MKKFAYILVALAAVVALSSCKCKKQEAVACCDNCTCEVCECTEGNCVEGCCGEQKPCCGEPTEGCQTEGGCTETPVAVE